MDSLITIFKTTGNLHHAYLLVGEKEETSKNLLAFIEKELKQSVKGNPDLFHEKLETMTIDDARRIQDRHSRKAFSEGLKIFIIELNFMSVEAQNSLLKMFEEPTPRTHFFIIAPSAEIFLPTVKSRLMILHPEQNGGEISDANAEKVKSAKAFLRAGVAERMKLVADIIEDKDKIKAIDLVNNLIRELHVKSGAGKESFVMTELLHMRAYLNDRSPSVKLILEHVCGILPKL